MWNRKKWKISGIAALIAVFGIQLTLAGENCTWGKSEVKTGSVAEKSLIKTSKNQQSKDRFPAIARADLEKAIESKAVFLIDANSSETYAAGHLPSAIHFSKQEKKFSNKLPEDKNALIVAYCGGPGCQAWCGAADELHEKGYKNIKHYKGGLREWKSAGLKLEQKKKSEES